MKNKTTLILIILFVTILQTSFLFEIFGYRVNPNLIGAICFAILLSGDVNLAFITAIIGGLFYDFAAGGTVGLGSFLLTSFVWLYSQLRSFYLRNWFSGVLFATIFFYAFRMFMARTLVFDGWILFSSFLSAVIGYLFSMMFHKESGQTLKS